MRNIFSRSYSPRPEGPGVLEADLTNLFAAVSPVRTFDLVAAPNVRIHTAPPRVRLARRFVLATASLAMVAIGAVVIVPQFTGGGTESATAAELIEKARTAARSDASFHRVHNLTIQEADGTVTRQTFAVWFKDSEHWRTESFETDAVTGQAGRKLLGVVREGDQVWTYFHDGEILRVINRSAAAVPTQDWSLHGDLESALVEYGPGRCSEQAKVAGREEVAGRKSYRIEFDLDARTNPLCGNLQSSTIWLDEETFLPVKSEQRSGEPGGVGSTTALMTHLEVGPLSNEDVTFVPPSGTWVNYQDRGEVIQVP